LIHDEDKKNLSAKIKGEIMAGNIRYLISVESGKQMTGLQCLFIKESQNMLSLYNQQRIDMVQNKNILHKFLNIIIQQELEIERNRRKLFNFIQEEPSLCHLTKIPIQKHTLRQSNVHKIINSNGRV
jgi:hypothetical protein